MTKKIVSATAVLIGVGSLLSGCSFDQPTAGCIVQDGEDWVAIYTRDDSSVTAECAGSEAAQLKGELVGIFKYTDANNRSDSKLVIRPDGLASRAERDPGSPYDQNAVGQMATEPDANDFCAVPEFSVAKVNDPGVIEDATTTPPTYSTPPASIEYQFSDFSMYAAPAAPGTIGKGQLTYTQDNCTVKYAVTVLWPAIGCVPGSSKPEESCGEGSGANPDFDLRCDEELEVCVPAKPVPSLK